MKCKYSKKGADEYYQEHIDEYEEAKAQSFMEFFKEDAKGYCVDELDINWYQGLLDSFTFPDESEWITSEYESMLGDCEDQAYEEYKDKLMEEKYD